MTQITIAHWLLMQQFQNRGQLVPINRTKSSLASDFMDT